MNNDLKNDIYQITQPLLDILKNNVKSLKSGQKGYDRCNNMINDGNLSYSQAKKFKNDLYGSSSFCN